MGALIQSEITRRRLAKRRLGQFPIERLPYDLWRNHNSGDAKKKVSLQFIT